MPINLNLSESVAASLLKSLESKLAQNEVAIQVLAGENKELKDSIRAIKESMEQSPIDQYGSAHQEYHKLWTIFRKTIFLLQKHRRPLSTREIVDYIIEEHEPELKPQRTKLVSAVSGVLSSKSKEGKILRGQNILGENVFSLPVETNNIFPNGSLLIDNKLVDNIN